MLFPAYVFLHEVKVSDSLWEHPFSMYAPREGEGAIQMRMFAYEEGG